MGGSEHKNKMESLNYKIDSARRELEEKNKKGEKTKVEKRVNKESLKIEWKNIKDVMLLGYLVYTLIALGIKINVDDVWSVDSVLAGSKVTIINQSKNKQDKAADPEKATAAPAEKSKGEFSAYNAEVGQTDGNPNIMASGKTVYEGAVANNCLPFGTKIKVNGVTKVVEDRMNSRYDCDHFDIYMTSRDKAIEFGRKEMEYEVI